MKNSALSIIAASLLTSMAHAGAFWFTPANPVVDADGQMKGILLAVDPVSIVFNGSERKAWTYMISVKGDAIQKIGGARYSYRCDQKEAAILQIVDFDPESLSPRINETTQPAELTYQSPLSNSLSESMFEFICSQRKGQPISSDSDTLFRLADADGLAGLKAEVPVYVKLMTVLSKVEDSK